MGDAMKRSKQDRELVVIVRILAVCALAACMASPQAVAAERPAATGPVYPLKPEHNGRSTWWTRTTLPILSPAIPPKP